MPRKQFVADLKKAKDGPLPPTIHDLREGDDDGQIEFTVMCSQPVASAIKVTAMVPDLSDYPSSHEYMIFSDDGASPQAAIKLQRLHGHHRKSIHELLELVAAALTAPHNDHDGDTQMLDSQMGAELEEDDSDVDIYDSDDDAFGTSGLPTLNKPTQTTSNQPMQPADFAFRKRVRSDLIAAKHAGFKVGHLGFLMEGTNAYVTVSLRMAKLGLSQEAMESWKVDPDEYLILILQYPNGYKTNEQLQSLDAARVGSNISIRVCAGKKYKPTLQEAIKAFSISKKDALVTNASQSPTDNEKGSIREVFISGSLNNLLQERLIPILRYRSAGMDWRGAETFFAQIMSASSLDEPQAPDAHFETEPVNDSRPAIVNADHYSFQTANMQYSFPLLAMQFLLRHFVRCTEFCLVCHDQLGSELEAIKPYVCDKPLCLYQYMTLGFGPSIEHEILMQPYVVDLLVSFCYCSARQGKLKDFPDGLALMVPVVPKVEPTIPSRYGYHPNTVANTQNVPDTQLPAYESEVGFDAARREIIFHTVPEKCPVKTGSWIIIKRSGMDSSELHCRVADATYFPTISIDEPIAINLSGERTVPLASIKKSVPFPSLGVSPAATPKFEPATLQLYDQDFEQLSELRKCGAICRLLETLPDVKSMQQRLKKGYFSELKDWTDSISPAALSLLRWIIASNRACIMQVDGDVEDIATGTPRDRVFGMTGYMQFRFAMGAPDKEQRFLQEVRKTTERLSLKFPTLFAWHGSPLHNWHTIIREGLHYNRVDHGRAFGDGVYHGKESATSVGYTGGVIASWPNSVLRISSALALNEIVNAPKEFQSNTPHFVVQHLDWIQTRYLFVQCIPSVESLQIREGKAPAKVFPQDPLSTPRGATGQIVIPASAIKSRVKKPSQTASAGLLGHVAKKIKTWHNIGTADSPIPLDDSDAADSDATDDEDVNMLRDEPEPQPEPTKTSGKAVKSTNVLRKSETDFTPGELKFNTLPLMPMPTYATPATTRRLMKELQNLAKAQEETPLADLGWYIDVEKIDNVYQWIVELHSFDKLDAQLPMVKEMEQKGVKSIVLEIRFNKDFPFTPPYIRVIRPRFLTFAQGGGGHIVMGGALCMELLTNTGWTSVSSMESVFMQVRLAIASKPFARLEKQSYGGKGQSQSDYGAAEAADGYIRACTAHGWEVPPGFREMAYGVKKA